MDPIFAGTVMGGMELFSQVRDSLNTAGSNVRKAGKFIGTGSLIDITSSARVEPITLVDADVVNMPCLSDLLQTTLSIFSGYYLQAIDSLTRIEGVTVAQKLAPLNPNRRIQMEAAYDWRMSVESYKHRLPTTKNAVAMAMESVELTTDKEALMTIKESTIMSVGKMFKVKIKENGCDASVNVAIRLMVNVLPTSTITHLMTVKSEGEMNLKERYHAWKAGSIRGIKDLLFCADIIKKHRNAIIKDKTNIYSQIIKRENSAISAGLASGNPSLAISSNILITSTDTIDSAHSELGGDLKNMKVRSAIFEGTNLMIIAVIDKEWQRVTFYYNGIAESSSASFTELKAISKNDGLQVSEILRTFMQGGAINL